MFVELVLFFSGWTVKSPKFKEFSMRNWEFILKICDFEEFFQVLHPVLSQFHVKIILSVVLKGKIILDISFILKVTVRLKHFQKGFEICFIELQKFKNREIAGPAFESRIPKELSDFRIGNFFNRAVFFLCKIRAFDLFLARLCIRNLFCRLLTVKYFSYLN